MLLNHVNRLSWSSFEVSGVSSDSEMNRSISVPLWFTVPFIKDPLGWIVSRYLFAHSLIVWVRIACTARAGEARTGVDGFARKDRVKVLVTRHS